MLMGWSRQLGQVANTVIEAGFVTSKPVAEALGLLSQYKEFAAL